MNSKTKFWDTKPIKTEDIDVRRKEVLDMIPPGNRVLDIACGDGMTLASIIAKEKHGIDINKKNVERSKKRGIKAVQRDIEEGLPYKNDFFDIVITEGLLNHLYSPESLVKEIQRVLKKDGYFVGSISNNYHIWHRVAYLLGRPQSSFPFRDKAAQVSSSFYTIKSMKELLSRYFEVEECTAKPGRFSSILPSLFGWDIMWKVRKTPKMTDF
jgi:methionine biosynthesis protein MetW